MNEFKGLNSMKLQDLSIEQLQQIVDGAPEGAEFYRLANARLNLYAYVSPTAASKCMDDIKLSDIRAELKARDVAVCSGAVCIEEETPELFESKHCSPRPLVDRELNVSVGQKHNHYFKDVSHLDEIDVYQVLRLFGVTDPCLQHIVKKALCAGMRGAKDFAKDVQEIADTANRLLIIEELDGKHKP